MVALFALFYLLLPFFSCESQSLRLGLQRHLTGSWSSVLDPLNENRLFPLIFSKASRFLPTLRGGYDSGVYDSVPEDDPMTPRDIARSEGSSHYSNGIYTLCTPRHSHVSYYGFMFNVRAKDHPIIITGIK